MKKKISYNKAINRSIIFFILVISLVISNFSYSITAENTNNYQKLNLLKNENNTNSIENYSSFYKLKSFTINKKNSSSKLPLIKQSTLDNKTKIKKSIELKDGISSVSLPNRKLDKNISKDKNRSRTLPLTTPDDYFYECNFYTYDIDDDGYYESVLAEFDVDTLEYLDYVTVIGGLFDLEDNLIDYNEISYWIYDQEFDYEYLDFTAFWNGTIGWDNYYVLLLLYDSNYELDDYYYSSNILLYVNPYDLFWECNFYTYDGDDDGYNDSVLAEFDVDTLQIQDYVTVYGYLFNDDDNLIDYNSVSYWVYDMEFDYEYLDFTILLNGTIGWDNYYVLLLLYDSNYELDDYYYSSNISLYLPIGTVNWTFMVYLDADNNLEPVGIDDFLEMASIGSNNNIHIVIQFDRTPGYDNRYDDWTTTKRYFITEGMIPNNANAIMDIGEKNMGDSQTLIDFVVWTINNYSSDHYCLVLWDHGSGWRDSFQHPQKGICFDYTNGNDYLNMSELKNAMNSIKNNLGKNIDIIGFDACLMGMLEVYYELNNTVDVVVGSEESVPWDGWPYDDILTELILNPNMTSENFATEIVENYMDYYGYTNELTMAAFNISKISNSLVSKVNIFSQNLIENLYSFYPEIYNARNATISYSYSEYRDLYDFAYEIKQRIDNNSIMTSAQDVIDVINESCIFESHGIFTPDSHGLSIYLDEDEIMYNSDYENIDFAIDTQWDEFLKMYYTDAYEPDDDYNQSVWIEGDYTKQLHNFHDIDDYDWVKFNATANITYILETSELGPGSDTYLYLYDTDGITLIDSDDDSGLGLASRISWKCPFSGCYYLMVKHWYNMSYGPKTYYKLSVFIPLTANYTFEPLHPTTQDVIYFNSTTYDPYNTIINWSWDFGDGNVSFSENTFHHFKENGNYNATLNITDIYGISDETFKLITVSNIIPRANFSYYPIYPTDLQVVSFSDNSTDIDGYINSWFWDFGDGNTSIEQNPTHQYVDDGNYLITLNVTDDDGGINETTEEIIITNVPPSVNFTYSPFIPIINDVIQFNDTSIDLDGAISSWFWDFGDGNTSSLQNPQHIYSSLKSYVVKLNVTDDDGDTNETNIQIITKTVYKEEIEPGEEIVDFMFEGDTNISINVNGTTNIIFEVYSDNPTFENILNNISSIDKFVNISVENESVIVWPMEIKIYYTEYDLINSGIEETQLLGLYFWNDAAEEWQLYDDTGVNTSYNQSGYEGYCWANIWHLTNLNIGGDAEPPSKVTGLKVSDGKDGKLNLAWNLGTDNVAVDYYNIYRDGLFLTTTSSNSYRDSGLINGQLYTYNISAVDIVGNEGELSDSIDGIPTATETGGNGGGYSGGDFFPPPDTNIAPVADAGGPYYEIINIPVLFNASGSIDSDGDIDSYSWDFGDGTTGTGVIFSKSYIRSGNFTITLTVTDNGGKTDVDTTYAIISSKPNSPPKKPILNGVVTGTINIDYNYTAQSIDVDNDNIRYVFDWDDGTNNAITEFVTNNTVYTLMHNWSNSGIYVVKVYAEDDKNAVSEIAEFDVFIDINILYIVELEGTLLDYGLDGIYEKFYLNKSLLTDVELQNDGRYLIDTDDDGEWNYIYDSLKDIISEYNKTEDKEGVTFEITWIYIIGLLVVIIIILIGVILYKKK